MKERTELLLRSILYYLNESTRLNYGRHFVRSSSRRDFIIDDDDIDMDMLEEEFRIVMYKIKLELIKAGYVVRLKDEANPKMSMYKSGFKLSIGALKASGKWLTRPIQKYPRHLFSEEKYMNFKGIKCLVPYPPEDYLEHVYGANWTVPISSDDLTDINSVKSFNFRSKA